MNPSDFYLKNIFDKFGYIANWFPNAPINLGDVGILEGYNFKRLSSLNELNLKFQTRPSGESVNFSYSCKADFNISTGIGGSLSKSSGAGSLKIGFHTAGSFVFETADCLIHEIENKLSLGEEIKKMYKAGLWNPEWIILDTIVHASSSTIIVANSKNSELELSAMVDFSTINLADANLDIVLKSQKGEITRFIGAQGLSPLFKTSKIKLDFLSKLTRNKDNARFGGHNRNRILPEHSEDKIWEYVKIS